MVKNKITMTENMEDKVKIGGKTISEIEKTKVVEAEEKAKVKVDDRKINEKKEESKKNKKEEIRSKDTAFVNGISLRISSKNCFDICKILKGKTPDRGIEILEEVVKKRRAIPMPNREVAHQKSRGMKKMGGGGFPRNASLEIIRLLKQLNANASVNLIENPIITIAKANKASRPYKREGRRAKRTHVYIEVKSKTKKIMENK